MPRYSSIYASQTDIERVNTAVQTNPDLNNPRGNGFFSWNISTNGYINYPALIFLYREIKDGTFDPNKSPENYLKIILSQLVEIQTIGNVQPGYSGEWNDLIKQKNYVEIVKKLVEAEAFTEPDHLCKHTAMIVLTLIALAKSDTNVVQELTTIIHNLHKDIDSFSRTIAKLETDYKGTTDIKIKEHINFLKSELIRLEKLSSSLSDAITFLRKHDSTDAILKLLDDLNTASRNQFKRDLLGGIQIELGEITQTYYLSEAEFMTMMSKQLKLHDSEIAFIINGWHQNGIPSHATPLAAVLSNQIDPSGELSRVTVQPTPIKITIKDGKLVEISSACNYIKKDTSLNGNNPDVLIGTTTVKYSAASNPKGITSIGENRMGSFPDINLEFSYQAKTPEGQLDLSIQLPTTPQTVATRSETPRPATEPQAVQTRTETTARPAAPAASPNARVITAFGSLTKKPKGQQPPPISREPVTSSSQKDTLVSGRKENSAPPTTTPTSTTGSAKPPTPVKTPQGQPPNNTATPAGTYSDPLGLTIRKPAPRTVGNPPAPVADTPAAKK